MSPPVATQEQLERLRKRKRLKELEAKRGGQPDSVFGIQVPNQQQVAEHRENYITDMRGQVADVGRKMREARERDPDYIGWTPGGKTDEQLGAERLGKWEGSTFGFGDEVTGIFRPEAGKKRRALKKFAREGYPEFSRGEMHGGVAASVFTAPLAGPKALQVARYVPGGPIVKGAVAGGTGAAAWDAAYQTGTGEGDALDRIGDIDKGQLARSTAGGAVLGGAGGGIAKAFTPPMDRLTGGASALREVLDASAGGTSGLSPNDIRVTERFLRDKGLSLNRKGRVALDSSLNKVGEPGGLSPLPRHLLPRRLKDVLIEGYDGGKGNLKDAIQGHLRGTTMLGGDESSAIIRNAAKEDLPASREFLKQGLKDTLGSQSRLNALDDINERLVQIGREGYEPLLKAGPTTPEGAQALNEVLNGPGMLNAGNGSNTLIQPLKTIAAGEGIDLDALLQTRPLEAAHWMQSRARQLSDRSSDAIMSNAMGSLRKRLLKGLNEATGGQYDAVRRQYGDEFGNLQALEFGDRFLTKASNDLDIDRMAREYAELSASQKEAALLSVRDAIQSSTGRGKAVNGPRMTRVSEEQVITALPEVFGEDGAKVVDLIEKVDDFVEGRKFVSQYKSDTSPNDSYKDKAIDSVQSSWRRMAGKTIQDLSADTGVSMAFGNWVPIRSMQRQARNFGKWVAGDPEGKLASIARVLEAPIGPPIKPPGGPVAPTSGNVPSIPPPIPTATAAPAMAPQVTPKAPGGPNPYIGRKSLRPMPANAARDELIAKIRAENPKLSLPEAAKLADEIMAQ